MCMYENTYSQGENAEIEFRVFGGADARLFELEADPAQPGVARIHSRQSFDYEAKTNVFTLEVQASRYSFQWFTYKFLLNYKCDYIDYFYFQRTTFFHCTRPSSRVRRQRPSASTSRNCFTYRSTGWAIDTQFTGCWHHACFVCICTLVKIVNFFFSDPDQNATLEYSVEPNDLLSVDRYTGRLSLTASWRRNIGTTVKGCVSGMIHKYYCAQLDRQRETDRQRTGRMQYQQKKTYMQAHGQVARAAGRQAER